MTTQGGFCPSSALCPSCFCHRARCNGSPWPPSASTGPAGIRTGHVGPATHTDNHATQRHPARESGAGAAAPGAATATEPTGTYRVPAAGRV